jgi:hypothetical protein
MVLAIGLNRTVLGVGLLVRAVGASNLLSFI